MAYGDRPLSQGDSGSEVTELQMRLAGFLGGVPDGDFGPRTRQQVESFQTAVMQVAPSGTADQATFDAIAAFGRAHITDFGIFACRCGQCGGFGRQQFKGEYVPGKARVEQYHKYEYPGLHRMILWAYAAAAFHCRARGLETQINSAYRCWVDNKEHGRNSTNHMGKALDIGFANLPAADRPRVANEVRSMLQRTALAQINWTEPNRKALEPESLARTWVHYDVRSYLPPHLDDRYFVRSLDELFREPPAA